MSNKPSKITIKQAQTIGEAFERFLLFKSAQGLQFKALQSYSAHFHAVSKYINTDTAINKMENHFLILLLFLCVKKDYPHIQYVHILLH